jgi:hypothetical protein
MKRRTQAAKLLATAIVFSIALTPMALAEGNIHIGKVKVKPEISYKLESNDNIFFRPTDEQDDIIHTITPGIVFDYEGRDIDNYFSAGYEVDIARYQDFSENDFESHRPFVDFSYKAPAGFYLKASDYYLRTADPFGDENQFALGVPQTKRWRNILEATIGYELFKRYAIEAFYSNNKREYDEEKDQWQDRTVDTYGGALVYLVSPKTHLFGEYRFADAEFDGQNDGTPYTDSVNWNSQTSMDSELQDVFLGARFRPGGKLLGEFKIGYSDLNFKNEFDPSGERFQDDGTWVAETYLDYQMRERTLFKLVWLRNYLPSNERLNSSPFVETKIGFDLEQGFARALSFDAGFDYIWNDYVYAIQGLPDQAFEIAIVRAGFGWDIKDWLETGVRYRFAKKRANEDVYAGREYDQNKLWWEIKAKW